MQGPMPTQEDVLKEFAARDKLVKDALEEEKKVKEQEKMRRVDTRLNDYRAGKRGVKTDEGGKFDETDEALLKPKKTLEPYEALFT